MLQGAPGTVHNVVTTKAGAPTRPQRHGLNRSFPLALHVGRTSALTRGRSASVGGRRVQRMSGRCHHHRASCRRNCAQIAANSSTRCSEPAGFSSLNRFTTSTDIGRSLRRNVAIRASPSSWCRPTRSPGSFTSMNLCWRAVANHKSGPTGFRPPNSRVDAATTC